MSHNRGDITVSSEFWLLVQPEDVNSQILYM